MPLRLHSWQQALALLSGDPELLLTMLQRGVGRGHLGWLQSAFCLGFLCKHSCAHVGTCTCVYVRKRVKPSGTECSLSLFHSSHSWLTCVFQVAGLGCCSKSYLAFFVTFSSTTHPCSQSISSPKATSQASLAPPLSHVLSQQPLEPLVSGSSSSSLCIPFAASRILFFFSFN